MMRLARHPLPRGGVAQQMRCCSHPAVWQPPTANTGEQYNQPLTHMIPSVTNRAKDPDPIPSALMNAKANFRYDSEFNFPDFEITLEIHSVLYPTTLVIFRCSPKLSETEIK
eukprot:Sspe_Gene.108984::Locus_88274_Transcript_1_1_Confidence_1.000_Length_633::g.108984::m.108984